MKKSIITTSLLLLLSPFLYGQQNFAGISFGTSIPLDDYAKAGDLSKDGYARTGASIQFDAAYFPVSYLGVGGLFGFGSNHEIKDSLMQDIIDYVIQNARTVIEIPDDADITYGSGFWNYINLFLGPHLSARPTQRLYLDLRILAGISIIKPPDHELIILFDDTEIYSRVSNSKMAFGYMAGAGLRFKINNIIALKLGIDYFRSNAGFNFEFDLFKGTAEEIEPIHSSYKIKALEITAGLAYSF